ncbi:MAG: PaaI family thioesterase [Alistipes sp.]|nr:PaaI family thioesterase [Alistipes sp.]
MKKIENRWIGQPDYHCFGCDPSHAHGLKMEFYEDGEDVVSIWQPTGEYQGWPNILHGGIQATLIDELCGWTIAHKFQSDAVTSKIEVRYRKPVKISEGKLTIRAHVVEVRRNIVTITAQIFNSANELCTEGTCVFFMISNLPK